MRSQPLQSADLDPQRVSRTRDGADLLTQIQVCRRLGISDQTWMRWRKALRTPTAVVMPSGRLRWRVSDIDALIGQKESQPAGRRFFKTARLRAVR